MNTNRFILLGICLALGACSDGSGPAEEEPQQFILVRRAWAPGERAARIAEIEASGALGFASPFAAQIYSDPDSVAVLQLNPAWTAAAQRSGRISAHLSSGAFALTWNIAGMRFETFNDSLLPSDPNYSLIWTGLFYYDPADTDNRGFILKGGPEVTFGPVNVNTLAFEQSGNRIGAGGGEVWLGSGSEWSAGGPTIPQRNTIQIDGQTFGAAQTVTSGAWTGGTEASGTMRGRAKRVIFTRTQGTVGPLEFEVDIDFSRTALPAIKLVCQYPDPCSTNLGAGAPVIRAMGAR